MRPWRKSFGIWVPDKRLADNRGFISPGIVGAVAGSRRRTAAGFTKYAENTSAESGLFSFSNGTNTYYGGLGQWAPAANVTVREVKYYLTKGSGDISGKTYTCEIYTQPGNDLVTLIEASAGVTGSNAWSGTQVTFSFSGAALTSGTQYAFALTTNAAVDASNYARISESTSGGIAGSRFGWQSTKAYGTFSTNDPRIEIWIQ